MTMNDWHVDYERRQAETLRAECTNPRIDWTTHSQIHGNWANWKPYIGMMTRGVWYTFTDDQKYALARDALNRAMEDYTEF